MSEEKNDETRNALVVQEQTAPAELLLAAIEKGSDIETLTRLMDLQERHEDNKARKAYHVAMAAFKEDPPTIKKTQEVDFKNKAGVRTNYKYADLAEAASLIGKALGEQGLSAAWRTEQKEGNNVTVACVITHVLGHSESTSLTAPPDESGNKDKIKALASTVTYLERYTLLALTGLAATGTDNDGAGATEKPVIEEAEAAELAHLIAETGADLAKFCEHFKVDKLEDLLAVDYQSALSLLKAKKKRAK